jgi:26S proteasome regulatory subunit N9
MAAAYLTTLIESRPEAGEAVQKLLPLLENKLWHQLTTTIEEEMSNPWLQENDTLVMFYECFIKEFETKINPVKMTEFAVAASQKFSDHDAAVEFLQNAMGRMKPTRQDKQSAAEEANIIFKCEIAMHKLALQKVDETKEMMKSAEKTLDAMNEISDLTYSFFYKLCCKFHQQRQAPAEFYRSTLQYLTYTPVDTLSSTEQCEIARDLCLAACAAESIFTFGELLQHPVLQSLVGTEFEWMPTMLKALNVGNIAEYEQICAKESSKIQTFDIMKASEALLKQKLSIAALIELIFRRKADERLIPFADIAEGTGLPLDQVELLLIKALSLKLIRGTLDEVDQNVLITWAIPHALDMDQISVMKDNLVSWRDKTQTTMEFVGDESAEIFT